MAQQENAPNKPVHLMYLCGAVLLFYLTMWSVDWVWGYFAYWPLSGPPSELGVSLFAAAFAIITTIICYRHDRVYSLANEVSGELKKVTWPTAKEVRMATTTVIVMALISAVILGVFDAIWSNLTELVYG